MGIPAIVTPRIQMPIALYFDLRDGINWNERGNRATKADLEAAINRSRGYWVPNEFLPSLSPGDVMDLVEGRFWIDRGWNVQPV
jgi:hypothetical protein